METARQVCRRNLQESVEVCDGSPELHVLAVDDSLVDRKVIERLLKISSCKGRRSKSLLFLKKIWVLIGF
jgi:two-component response regulator (ARR-A family)